MCAAQRPVRVGASNDGPRRRSVVCNDVIILTRRDPRDQVQRRQFGGGDYRARGELRGTSGDHCQMGCPIDEDRAKNKGNLIPLGRSFDDDDIFMRHAKAKRCQVGHPDPRPTSPVPYSELQREPPRSALPAKENLGRQIALNYCMPEVTMSQTLSMWDTERIVSIK